MHDNRPRTFILTLACTEDGEPVLIPASTDPRHPRNELETCPTLQILIDNDEEPDGWEEAYEALLGKDVKVTITCKCPPYPNPHWQTDGLAEGLARPTIIDHETTCPNFPRDVLWQLLAERVMGGLQVVTAQTNELLEPGRLGTVGAPVNAVELETIKTLKSVVASMFDDVFRVEAGEMPESLKEALSEHLHAVASMSTRSVQWPNDQCAMPNGLYYAVEIEDREPGTVHSFESTQARSEFDNAFLDEHQWSVTGLWLATYPLVDDEWHSDDEELKAETECYMATYLVDMMVETEPGSPA